VNKINDVINRDVFKGDNNENLKENLMWRADHVGQSVDFWELAKADLPWQIAEGGHINMNGPSEGIRTTMLEMPTQSLTRHVFFKDAHVARNPFRCFHRDDGMSVSFSRRAVGDFSHKQASY
jgi:hypothetical protein